MAADSRRCGAVRRRRHSQYQDNLNVGDVEAAEEATVGPLSTNVRLVPQSEKVAFNVENDAPELREKVVDRKQF